MPGTIRNRGKNSKNKKPNWEFAFEGGYDSQGKRRRISQAGFATKAEAVEAMKEALAEFKLNGLPSKNKPKKQSVLQKRRDRQTLAEYLTGWLADPDRGLRDTAADNYDYLLMDHVVPAIGNILLCNLDSDHIKSMYESREDYALNTRQRIHGVLRSALEDAVEQKMISFNPCLKSLRPKKEVPRSNTLSYSIEQIDELDGLLDLDMEDDTTVNAMTDEELERFLAVSKGKRFEAAHLLAARRGPRRGEVLGLVWRDIDFQRRTLTIKRSLVVYRGKPVFHAPKTSRSVRTITLSDELSRPFMSTGADRTRRRCGAGIPTRMMDWYSRLRTGGRSTPTGW